MKFLRKSSPIFCMLLMILFLSGCSSKQEVHTSSHVLVLTPESLLVDPCEPKGAGYTVRSLASGYVSNTSCIGQYRLLLIKQRKYRDEMELIYAPSK